MNSHPAMDQAGLSYQVCRWYDPYPRLAFALKLMSLAPMPLQLKAGTALQDYLEANLGSLPPAPPRTEGGKRWYDCLDTTAHAVEMLRTSPESMKTQMADVLLRVLTE